jgi:hypothetical protein
VGAELCEGVLEVGAYRARGDEELRRDLAVSQTVANKAEHLEFAAGEAECALALPGGFRECDRSREGGLDQFEERSLALAE